MISQVMLIPMFEAGETFIVSPEPPGSRRPAAHDTTKLSKIFLAAAGGQHNCHYSAALLVQAEYANSLC